MSVRKKAIGGTALKEIVEEILDKFNNLNSPVYFLSSKKYSMEYQKQPEMSAWEFSNILTEVGYLAAVNTLDQVLWLMTPTSSMDNYEKRGILKAIKMFRESLCQSQKTEDIDCY